MSNRQQSSNPGSQFERRVLGHGQAQYTLGMLYLEGTGSCPSGDDSSDDFLLTAPLIYIDIKSSDVLQ